MPKLILRCNYLKNAPPSHLANYMNYISTREGVEKIDNTCGLLPASIMIISRGQQERMRQSLLRRHWKTTLILLPRRKTI